MKGISLLLVACCVLLAAFPAHALKISPFKTTLSPQHANGTQVFRIENNTDEPVAVQVDVRRWDIQPDGREKNEPADDLFTVFPAQMVLQARDSRAVRVQWLGDKAVTQEIPFRLVAEQVPIVFQETPRERSGLAFMVRFLAGLYVAPPRVSSDIKVERVEALDTGLRVHLVNRGTGHSLLRQPRLTLRGDNGGSVTLGADRLGALAGANVHAGKSRFFDIARPAGIQGVITGEIDYQQGF